MKRVIRTKTNKTNKTNKTIKTIKTKKSKNIKNTHNTHNAQHGTMFNKCMQNEKRSSMSYHFTSNTDFYMTSTSKDNWKFLDALDNNFKPCFLVNEMIHMKCFDPVNNGNHLDEHFVLDHLMQLCPGSLTIMNEPNAGGSSMSSEVLSFEILHRMYGAQLEATEMDIEYCPIGSKKTDYSVKINGTVFGVSVTRAFNYLGKNRFTQVQARYLLMKKLNGVIHSTRNVVTKFSWNKQILHVYTDTIANCKILRNEYLKLKKEYRFNTIVMVTVAQRADYLFKKVKHVKHLQIQQQQEQHEQQGTLTLHSETDYGMSRSSSSESFESDDDDDEGEEGSLDDSSDDTSDTE